MTAVTTFTDAELVETLSRITTKLDALRHQIAADQQLTVSEAADLAAAIEEIAADTYRVADRLATAGHGAAEHVHVLAESSAKAAAHIRTHRLHLVPKEASL